jgi:hypothetical protein
MKRLLVALVVFTVMVFASCSNWNWDFGWGTKANALPQSLFNAGVKKQIFYVAGGAVATYNTSEELAFDGTFLSFNDKTGTFNVTGVSDGSLVSVPPQNAFTNQVAIPVAQIIRIVEFQ